MSEDMLSAEAFANLMGRTQVTVDAKRGYRFLAWQLDGDGKPYGEIAALHETLCVPWTVYRFLA